MRIRRARTAARQVADQVAPRVVLALDRVRHRRGPQREPVVVLGGEHDVASAGGLGTGRRARRGRRRPTRRRTSSRSCRRGSRPRTPVRGAAASGCPGSAWSCGTTRRRGSRRSIRTRDPGGRGAPGCRHLGRPARHRVEAPVQEDAELGVVVPSRHIGGCAPTPTSPRTWQLHSRMDRPALPTIRLGSMEARPPIRDGNHIQWARFAWLGRMAWSHGVVTHVPLRCRLHLQ